MASLTDIQATEGVIRVRFALHGRPELTRDVPAGELVDALSLFERSLSVTVGDRRDPQRHRRVRTDIVVAIEAALDGKVGPRPSQVPVLAAYGAVWCLVYHYRDAETSRTSMHRLLARNGLVHVDLVTTANDQVGFTISEMGALDILKDVVTATAHGTRIGISNLDGAEPVVTAYEVPDRH